MANNSTTTEAKRKINTDFEILGNLQNFGCRFY